MAHGSHQMSNTLSRLRRSNCRTLMKIHKEPSTTSFRSTTAALATATRLSLASACQSQMVDPLKHAGTSCKMISTRCSSSPVLSASSRAASPESLSQRSTGYGRATMVSVRWRGSKRHLMPTKIAMKRKTRLILRRVIQIISLTIQLITIKGELETPILTKFKDNDSILDYYD